MNTLFLANMLLAIVWAAITGAFTLPNLLFGFLIGAVALYLIRGPLNTEHHFVRFYRIGRLISLFVVELVKSALRVTVIIVTSLRITRFAFAALRSVGVPIPPDRELRPGIIAYPLQVDRNFEITLLANLITLTPGTLSVDVSRDRKTLFIHCIDVPEPKVVTDSIRDGFERKILEAFR